MSRYVVEDSSHPSFPERCWDVLDSTQDGTALTDRYLSQAEAHIIAWALNQVADGRDLYSAFAPDAMGYTSTKRYYGPRDGIAS